MRRRHNPLIRRCSSRQRIEPVFNQASCRRARERHGIFHLHIRVSDSLVTKIDIEVTNLVVQVLAVHAAERRQISHDQCSSRRLARPSRCRFGQQQWSHRRHHVVSYASLTSDLTLGSGVKSTMFTFMPTLFRRALCRAPDRRLCKDDYRFHS